ncbi:cell wall integrity/stress response component [Perilla frutescens var. frutescens]|nr:cell wall integrity/stress response component [Perilla frutescens var. frutescens]
MAVARYSLAPPPETAEPLFTAASVLAPPLSVFSFPLSQRLKPCNFCFSSQPSRTSLLQVNSKPNESEAIPLADTFAGFKQLLLPVIDRNPYLTDGTKQATSTTAALAKKYGAEITVVVIDEKERETLPEHETQLASIRWHLSEGGFQEFKLLERLGEGNKPTAIIGEVADEMNMDLVVMSMETIHSKHVDANLLAEFIPCPVLLLPL